MPLTRLLGASVSAYQSSLPQTCGKARKRRQHPKIVLESLTCSWKSVIEANPTKSHGPIPGRAVGAVKQNPAFWPATFPSILFQTRKTVQTARAIMAGRALILTRSTLVVLVHWWRHSSKTSGPLLCVCLSRPLSLPASPFSVAHLPSYYASVLLTWHFPIDSISDKDNCANSPCQNGGTCVDLYKKYSCQCKPGYTGSTCSVNINECANGPCKNGGKCTDGINLFTCR